jgi:hypothetical protein
MLNLSTKYYADFFCFMALFLVLSAQDCSEILRALFPRAHQRGRHWPRLFVRRSEVNPGVSCAVK